MTPLPGIAVADSERARLRERFIARFVKPDERHVPFWFSLPYWPIARDVFQSPQFGAMTSVYFMVGNGARIHLASGAEVARFFADQKPWEGMLFYVFEQSLAWCIASTDELIWDHRHDADFLLVKGGALSLPHQELRDPSGRDHYPGGSGADDRAPSIP